MGVYNKHSVGSSTTNPAPGLSQTSVPVINIPFGPEYTSGPAASPSNDILNHRFMLAPGTRDEITTADFFYRVDIDLDPPIIHIGTWRLAVSGLVQNPTSFSLTDIVSYPAVSQAVTLACISNPVGGYLIGTEYWTGVPLNVILNKCGLQPGAGAVSIKAADGFFESIPLTEAMDDRTLLVYAMNGQSLVPIHGYPLRMFIPNHYGMKQPKWITQMEVTNVLTHGWYEDQGWSATAIPQTTSWIDTIIIDPNDYAKNGSVPLGGFAWAGERTIKKVELQFGDLPWIESELCNPPVSPLTWVPWRYDWTPAPGSYQVKVRATDGNGDLQIAKNETPYPEGPTGIEVVNYKF